MLLDVDADINQIPDEDVESILMRLKSRAMTLDVTRAEDREKVTAIISATLADKNARYQRRLRDLEDDHKRQLHRAAVSSAKTEDNLQSLLESSRSDSQRALEQEREARIQAENDRLRIEGYCRFWMAIFASVAVGVVLGWVIVPVLTAAFDGWLEKWVWPPVTLASIGGVTILMQQLALRKIVGESRVAVMPKPYQHLMGE